MPQYFCVWANLDLERTLLQALWCNMVLTVGLQPQSALLTDLASLQAVSPPSPPVFIGSTVISKQLGDILLIFTQHVIVESP